jgi:hypothetical protein
VKLIVSSGMHLSATSRTSLDPSGIVTARRRPTERALEGRQHRATGGAMMFLRVIDHRDLPAEQRRDEAIRRASSSRTSPAIVSVTRRPVRLNSRAPTSSSSSAIWWDTAGCDRLQASAAFAKCRSSATLVKVRSSLNSIQMIYHRHPQISLDEWPER